MGFKEDAVEIIKKGRGKDKKPRVRRGKGRGRLIEQEKLHAHQLENLMWKGEESYGHERNYNLNS